MLFEIVAGDYFYKKVLGKLMIDKAKTIARYLIKKRRSGPVLGDSPFRGPEESLYTFVVVCREGFDINLPNANSTIRLGYCRAFKEIGVRYRLVSVFDIERVLPELKNPFIFLSVYDYLDMSKGSKKVLKNYKHFVWVSPDVKKMQKIYSKYGYVYQGLSSRLYKLVSDTGPAFVWAPVPPSCLDFYEEWRKYGQDIRSLPQACDVTRYYPEKDKRSYSDVKMSFVGGYLEKKKFQFEKYLKPYEDILTVFGYTPWPYKGYRGLLPEDDERVLYKNSRVCPALSEPHAEVMGDIVERVFKILGSGGLAVTDVIPFYRELFGPDELLVPSDLGEYNEMIKQALDDDDFNSRYRKKGYKAILERHTYVHRARQVLSYLGLRSKLKNKVI